MPDPDAGRGDLIKAHRVRRPALSRAACSFALVLCIALAGCTSVVAGAPKAAKRRGASNGPIFPSQLVDLLTPSMSIWWDLATRCPNRTCKPRCSWAPTPPNVRASRVTGTTHCSRRTTAVARPVPKTTARRTSTSCWRRRPPIPAGSMPRAFWTRFGRPCPAASARSPRGATISER